MDLALINESLGEAFSLIPFIGRINSTAEYEAALALLEELEELERQGQDCRSVTQLVDNVVALWESRINAEDELLAFNRAVADTDSANAVLAVLMDQYQLKPADLKQEIGCKSLVSMILSGKRKLTAAHINALSQRFGVSPSQFFPRGGSALG